MYVVTVTFEAYAAHIDAFRDAVLAQARTSLDREPECRRFDVCLAADHPGRVFLYELYDTPAAFQAHLKSDHFKSFNATVTPWVRNKHVDTWNLSDPASVRK